MQLKWLPALLPVAESGCWTALRGRCRRRWRVGAHLLCSNRTSGNGLQALRGCKAGAAAWNEAKEAVKGR